MNLVAELQKLGFVIQVDSKVYTNLYKDTMPNYDIIVVIKNIRDTLEASVNGYHKNMQIYSKSIDLETAKDTEELFNIIHDCEMMQKNMAIHIRKNELNKDFK